MPFIARKFYTVLIFIHTDLIVSVVQDAPNREALFCENFVSESSTSLPKARLEQCSRG